MANFAGMGLRGLLLAGGLIACGAVPLSAKIAIDDDAAVTGGGGVNLPPYLQCVPYARTVTGIQIRGDAWTWWGQAEGRYARGFAPKVGAVMALRPHGNSHLGHVAAVSRIVDDRTILIRHANWSPINGRRGQIEDNVRVIDVSPENDWSAVRVWYAPIRAIGGSIWPVQGFIYPAKSAKLAAKMPAKSLALRGTRAAGAPINLLEPARARTGNAPTKFREAKAARNPIGDIIGKRMGW